MVSNKIFKIKEFELAPRAKEAGAVTELLQSFGNQKDGGNIFKEAENLLLDLLALTTGERGVSGQNTYLYIEGGIKKMFHVLSLNKVMIAAPKNEEERLHFYEKLAYGYKFVGDAIKEEYKSGNMDKKDVYSCLDSIGDGGHACAGRWRSVLEELVRGFSYKITGPGMAKEHQPDRLKEQMGELFFNGRVIEGNKASEDFVNNYYPDMLMGNRLHYTTFFKRALNVLMDYNLPTSMEGDSYVHRDQYEIFLDVERYLDETTPLDHRVIERVVSMVQENIKTDNKLYEAVVNDAIGQYHGSTILGKKYEDATEFMFEEIFQGYSKEIKKEALLEIFQNKGFVQVVDKEIHMNIFEEIHNLMDSGTPSRKLERLLANHQPDEGRLFKEFEPFVQEKNSHGENLLYVGMRKDMMNLTQFLLKHGVDLNIQRQDGSTVLMLAIDKGHTELAKLLIEKDADLNLQTKNYKSTALMKAISRGNFDLSKLLIEKGADLELLSWSKNSALTMATWHDNDALVELLVEKGVNLNGQIGNGRTALIFAARRGNLKISKLLIEKGANLNLQSKDGTTALMDAIKSGHTALAKLLIEKGADIELKDRRKKTALTFAKQLNNKALIPVIRMKITENMVLKMSKNKGKPRLGVLWGFRH